MDHLIPFFKKLVDFSILSINTLIFSISLCISSILDVEICGEDLIKQMLICVQNVVKAAEEFKATSGLFKIPLFL